jgi:hypothetical protein
VPATPCNKSVISPGNPIRRSSPWRLRRRAKPRSCRRRHIRSVPRALRIPKNGYNTPAATGTPRELYTNAKNRFYLILRMVPRLSFRARTMPSSVPLTRVTPARFGVFKFAVANPASNLWGKPEKGLDGRPGLRSSPQFPNLPQQDQGRDYRRGKLAKHVPENHNKPRR